MNETTSMSTIKSPKTNGSKNYTLIILIIIAQLALVLYTIRISTSCKQRIDEKFNDLIDIKFQEHRFKRQIDVNSSIDDNFSLNKTSCHLTSEEINYFCTSEINNRKNEPVVNLPNLDNCKLRRIGIPLYNALVPNTMYGTFLKDAMPKRMDHVNKLWITKGYRSRHLYEYDNLTQLDTNQRASHTYTLPHGYYGTGHVIYQGSLYYHSSNQTNLILRYDLALKKILAKSTLHFIVKQDLDPKTCYIYNKHREHVGCLDFSVDENGLWLIYRNASRKTIFVSKLNADNLSIERTIKIDLYGDVSSHAEKLVHKRDANKEPEAIALLKDTEELLNGFIICGKIYFLQYSNTRHLLIRIVHDLYKINELNYLQSIKFIQPFLKNSQLTYNPYDRKLYAWDGEYLMTYALETRRIDE